MTLEQGSRICVHAEIPKRQGRLTGTPWGGIRVAEGTRKRIQKRIQIHGTRSLLSLRPLWSEVQTLILVSPGGAPGCWHSFPKASKVANHMGFVMFMFMFTVLFEFIRTLYPHSQPYQLIAMFLNDYLYLGVFVFWNYIAARS